MADQAPSVGRIVHYVSYGSPVRPDGSQAYTQECRAAVITQVLEDGVVGLCVLNPTGQFFNAENDFDRGGDPDPDSNQRPACDGLHHQGGTWHWPERVG